MNHTTIPVDYTNDLIFELEKAFWDERGKGARFRLTTVGREYYKNKCLPVIQSNELDSILQTIGKILKDEGITGEVSFSRAERILRVRVEHCVHRKVEDRMVDLGIEPFTCLPANLIALAIEDKLDRPVELAEIKLEDGACQLALILFEQRPTLG